jgi:hypothetical protein
MSVIEKYTTKIIVQIIECSTNRCQIIYVYGFDFEKVISNPPLGVSDNL